MSYPGAPYKSQSTLALELIDSSKYPDTNKDFEKNIQRLNEFTDYIGQYLQVMQKGVDQANQDAIGKVRGFATNLLELFGNGQLLSGINLGDLQYYLPAIGALFGFDSTTPFPINLLNAAEHFFLGFVVPLDSFSTTINDLLGGFLTSLGFDSSFIQALKDIVTAFGNIALTAEDFLTTIDNLFGVFGISSTDLGPFGIFWNAITTLLGGFNLSSLGSLVNPYFHAIAPWIEELATLLNDFNSFLKIFSGGTTDLQGLLNFGSLFSGFANFLPGGGTFNPLTSWANIFPQILTAVGIPGLDASKIITGSFGVGLLQPFIDAISNGFGGANGLNFGGLTSLLTAIPGIGPIINTFVSQFLGLTGGTYGINDLVRAIQSIPANFISGILAPGQASHLTVGTVSSVIQEFLTNGNFDTANSINGQAAWMWDGTQGPGGGVLTSVYTNANSTLRELFSNSIPVAPGQVLNITGNTMWGNSFAGGANSIALTVQELAHGVVQSVTTIGSIASPGATGAWTLLSNPTYTVPSGIDSIFLRPIVTATATAGRVWFGKLSVKSTATTVSTPLVPGLDASKIISGQFLTTQVTSLAGLLSGFGTSGTSIISQIIGVIPNLFGGLSGLSGLGSIFTDLFGLLGSPTSIGGGSPLLPGIGSIPVIGGLLSGGVNLLTSIIPGLDATKIISGVFPAAITGIQTIISTVLGSGSISDLATSLLGTLNLSNGTASNIFSAWYHTTPGTPSVANVNTAVGNMRTIVVDGYTLQTFGTSTTWTIPAYSEMWFGAIGAGQKGGDGIGTSTPANAVIPPGAGALSGGYSTQKMPLAMTGDATITIGSYSTGSASSVSASGGYVSTQPGIGQVISVTAAAGASSTPGAGGEGGQAQVSCYGLTGIQGVSGVGAPGGAGGSGASGSSSAYGGTGSTGGAGNTSSLPVTGGGGGGGGGGASATTAFTGVATGGSGGAGGFPGGGGGGGGSAASATSATAGAGAYGANGFAWIIYK